MGLGSRAWIIPTSIPEERKRAAPWGCVLVLCWAGKDQAELQGSSEGAGGSSLVPSQRGTPGVIHVAVPRLVPKG